MILAPPELWESRQTPPPSPIKKILQSKDHSYNKWTQIRLHQDSYLKNEKQKREPIPIPIVEPASTKPIFITKPKRKLLSVHFLCLKQKGWSLNQKSILCSSIQTIFKTC